MSREFKYQQQYASALAKSWLSGNQLQVRASIRNLNNKAQAAHIAAEVLARLIWKNHNDAAYEFLAFMHPNER